MVGTKLTNSNGNNGLHVRKSYAHHLKKLPVGVWDVETYRVESPHARVLGPPARQEPPTYSAYDHFAVVVLKNGEAFVGWALCNERDQYSRRRGHAIAVGRALHKAVSREEGMWDFHVPTNQHGEPAFAGVKLRDYCRLQVPHNFINKGGGCGTHLA